MHPLRHDAYLKNQEVLQLANIKSAKKRILVNRNKALQNKMFKTQLKTLIKKYDAALASGDKEAAMAAYKLAVKLLFLCAALFL